MVTWKKKGGYYISGETHAEWVVKIPTVKHRLHKTGTVGLDMTQRYDLNHKRGVLFVDGTLKKYCMIPSEILKEYFVKMCDYAGIRNTIAQYDVKKLIADGRVELFDIKDDSKVPQKVSDPVLDAVKAKFGLT